jgi:TonB family protein
MAFTGQLNDLALSELIEFFCNQRKTGRLKVDYALAPGVFFIKDGDLVDAKVGALNGTEAVFFALTLPSASFDFSAGMQSSRRTINESWASVVLEGLRRIDEGIMPDASQAFASEQEIDEATIAYLNCIEVAKEETAAKAAAKDDSTRAANDSLPLPFAQTLEATRSGGGKSRLVIAGVVAALVAACLVAAIPLSKRLTRSPAAAATVAAPAAAQTTTGTSDAQGDDNAAASATPAASTDPNAVAAMPAAAAAAEEEAARLARREREAREARQRKLQEAKKAEAAQAATEAAAPEAAPKPVASGPKSVRVSITYDEAGRVTQTSVVGSSPGAEAYASTAVRVARGRRFPAGKAGSTVVTIPIN